LMSFAEELEREAEALEEAAQSSTPVDRAR
jgi:hypothetical protein